MSRRLVIAERIANSIYLLGGQKVMLDFDLATLYGVATKALNQAVKRNASRFPADFMFRLSVEEVERLGSQFVTLKMENPPRATPSRSQTVTLKQGKNIKYRPYAFTEQGVAMLSSVLRSERAVQVNIAIMRAFVKLRAVLETNRELAKKFSELEKRVGEHDSEIAAIIDAIRQLMAPPTKPAREIGFHLQETPPRYGKRKRT
ncbi:ORF6N domain-containing protein [soil metagenome]